MDDGSNGIYWMATIATVASGAIVGLFLFRNSKRAYWTPLLLCVLFQLPVAYLTFEYVRKPMDLWLRSQFGPDYAWIPTLYAPITEELVKLWPLLLPFLWKRLSRENATYFAMALGLGFGLGEIWLLASRIAANPEMNQFPWYYYGGFLGERILVCFIHGGLTVVAVRFLKTRYFLAGLLGSMILHYLLNLPIFLSRTISTLPESFWPIYMQIHVLLFFFFSAGLLSFFAFGTGAVARLFFGDKTATCTHCGFEYPQPLLGLNLVTGRYVRCPSCKKWHWSK